MMRVFIFLVGSILLSSCASVYFPNTRNAPMFSGKGEFQGSITTVFGNNLQTAYAITDHIGVTANIMNVISNDFGNHNYREVSLGYYKNPVKSIMRKGTAYADFFGGYGEGNVEVSTGGPKDYSTHKYFQGSYQKFFIQPSIAYKFTVESAELGPIHFYAGVAYRASLLDISRISGQTSPAAVSTALTPIVFNKTHLFFHEPAFIGKVVIKQFYLTYQGGLNFTFGNTNDFDYNPIQMSVGGGVILNFKREKK